MVSLYFDLFLAAFHHCKFLNRSLALNAGLVQYRHCYAANVETGHYDQCKFQQKPAYELLATVIADNLCECGFLILDCVSDRIVRNIDIFFLVFA